MNNYKHDDFDSGVELVASNTSTSRTKQVNGSAVLDVQGRDALLQSFTNDQHIKSLLAKGLASLSAFVQVQSLSVVRVAFTGNRRRLEADEPNSAHLRVDFSLLIPEASSDDLDDLFSKGTLDISWRATFAGAGVADLNMSVLSADIISVTDWHEPRRNQISAANISTISGSAVKAPSESVAPVVFASFAGTFGCGFFICGCFAWLFRVRYRERFRSTNVLPQRSFSIVDPSLKSEPSSPRTTASSTAHSPDIAPLSILTVTDNVSEMCSPLGTKAESEESSCDILTQALLAEAAEKHADGDFEATVQICEDALARLRRRGLTHTVEGVQALRALGDAVLAVSSDASEASPTQKSQTDCCHEALDWFEKAHLTAEQIGPGGVDKLETVKVLINIAQLRHGDGNVPGALHAIFEAQHALGPSDQLDNDEISLFLQMGQVRKSCGDPAGALVIYTNAHETWKKNRGPLTKQVVTLMGEIAHVQIEQQDFESAAQTLVEATNCFNAMDECGIAEANLKQMLVSIGTAETALKGCESADSLYQQALQYVKTDRERACVLANMVDVRKFLGDAEGASKFLHEALGLLANRKQNDCVDGNLSEDATLFRRIGCDFEALGKFRTALDCYSEGLNVLQLTGQVDVRDGSLLHYGCGSVQLKTGRLNAAFDSFAEAERISENNENILDKERLQILESIGSCARSLGQHSKAIEFYMKAQITAEKNPDIKNFDLIRVMSALGAAQGAAGELSLAQETLASAEKLTVEFENSDAEEIIGLMVNIGIMNRNAGEIDEALRRFENVRHILDSCGRCETLQYASLLVHIGIATASYSVNGTLESDHSEPCAEVELALHAVEIVDHLRPIACPDTAFVYAEFARSSFAAGRLAEAASAYQKAVSARRSIGTLATLTGARLLINSGITQIQQGELMNALETFREARRIYEAMGLLNTRIGVPLLVNLGSAHSASGDHELALNIYEEARELCERTGGLNNDEGAELISSIGVMKAAIQDYEGAIRSYTEARAIYKGLGKSKSTDYVQQLVNIGFVKNAQGNNQQALENYEQALGTLVAAGRVESQIGAQLFSLIAVSQTDSGNLDEAADAFAEAHRIHEKCGTADSRSAAIVMKNLRTLDTRRNSPCVGNVFWTV